MGFKNSFEEVFDFLVFTGLGPVGGLGEKGEKKAMMFDSFLLFKLMPNLYKLRDNKDESGLFNTIYLREETVCGCPKIITAILNTF